MKNKIILSAVVAALGLSNSLNADTMTTLNLESSHPYIYFDDTDYTGSAASATQWDIAPEVNANASTNMWRLYDVINYIGTGSLDKATVLEVAGSSAGNNSHSFMVNTSGDITLANGSVFIDRSANKMGIGTVTPAYSLDVVGDIRIGNSGNRWITSTGGTGLFFKNDNTHRFPFGVENDAPSNSLRIKDSGNVGVGTSDAQAKLDVRGDIKASWSGSNSERDGTKYLTTLSADNSAVGKTSDAGFALENVQEDFKWEFRSFEATEGFTATKALSGGGEFRIDNPTNDYRNAKMLVAGVTVFRDGHLVTASSRKLKANIKPLDTQAALDAFHELEPVSYAYKAHKDEPVVGFIAEDIPELVAMPSRTVLDSTEIVAVLTTVLQEQDRVLSDTRAELKIAQDKIAKLEKMQKRLARVESLLTNLALKTSNTKQEKVSLNSK